MTINVFKIVTSTDWNGEYQPLSFDMTKGLYTG